ncbi:hypothetical protein [Clostridium hydrogenum]|uniref:hypothetical protein n=1 Tax=Clostridium hydrogenum TaxID=2855764 RepID=UPI001F2503FF|nr:hypothetical protein [Clostridium hydrogenum]
MGASELEYSASIISECSCNIKNEKSNFSNGLDTANLDNRDEENTAVLQIFDTIKTEVLILTNLMDGIAEELREEANRLRQAEEAAKQQKQAGA